MWSKLLQGRVTLFLVVLVVLVGCKKPPVTTVPKVVETGIAVKEQRFEPNYLTSRLKFKYQDAEQSLSGSASLRMVKDSAAWISITAILGIEAARILFLPDRVLYANKLEGDRQTLTYLQLSEMTGMPTTLATVQDILLGNDPFGKRALEEKQSGDSTWYRYPYGEAALIRSVAKLGKLKSTASGQAQTQVSYMDFKEAQAGKGIMPFKKHVVVTMPKGFLNVELEHTRLDLPQTAPELPW